MRSRSGRRRPHVTPDAVVAAAMKLLDEGGMEAVTFRAVAKDLGVQAPALYWHFLNKRDLMDDLAQAILVEGGVNALQPPAKASEWQEWLATMARTVRAALVAHRDGGRVVAGASFFRARSLARLVIVASDVLRDAGFGLLESSLSAATVIDYVWGFVIEEQEGTGPEKPDAEFAAKLKSQSGEFFGEVFGVDPRLAHLSGQMIEERKKYSDDDLFEWGLQTILDGLSLAKKTRRAPARTSRARSSVA